MWYFTLSWDFGLWRLVSVEQIQRMFVDLAAQWPLPPPPQPVSGRETSKNPPFFFLRHSTYITTKSSFRLTWSCSSAHVSSTQALCLHVTLFSKPLKEDIDFSNFRKRLKMKKNKIIRWSASISEVSISWTEKRTSNTLPVSLFRPMC